MTKAKLTELGTILLLLLQGLPKSKIVLPGADLLLLLLLQDYYKSKTLLGAILLCFCDVCANAKLYLTNDSKKAKLYLAQFCFYIYNFIYRSNSVLGTVLLLLLLLLCKIRPKANLYLAQFRHQKSIYPVFNATFSMP
jgi:hypothetical protein